LPQNCEKIDVTSDPHEWEDRQVEDPKGLSLESIQLAVDLAKAGMSPNTAAFMNNPEVVAKFIEVVSRKIESLMAAANSQKALPPSNETKPTES
jgi:hypothetical protein